MYRLEANVRGRVQGVSFRYYTQMEAKKLGLTGWVRNERDGSVTVIAEGPKEVLNRLIKYLQHGPRMANVNDLTTEWSLATLEFEDFDIRWL